MEFFIKVLTLSLLDNAPWMHYPKEISHLPVRHAQTIRHDINYIFIAAVSI